MRSKNSIGRRDALAAGLSVVDSFDAFLGERRGAVLEIGAGRMNLAAALRSHLAARVADALQIDGSSVVPPAFERGRRLLYATREWVALSAAARGSKSRTLPRSSVLVVARTRNHFRDIVPVAERAGREHGLSFAWLAFRQEHLALIPREGARVLAQAYGAAPVGRALWTRKAVTGLIREWREGSRAHFAADVLSRAAYVLRSELAYQSIHALVAAAALSRAFEQVRPRLVLVGNPSTMEGGLAITGARAAHVPTLSLQHGEIGPTQFEWRSCGVDQLAVWGERPKRALAELGFPEDRIVVTGAPWTDKLADIGGGSAEVRSPCILVALSGAGHSVGRAEHLDHVRRLFEAAAELRSHEWVFRLHPKDDPAIYRRLMPEFPTARVTLIEARKAPTEIHDQLRDAAVLITVTSASALDAMLRGVPVVTLARAKNEAVSGYVAAGVTTHVPRDARLADTLQSLLRDGQTIETRERATGYVREFFGKRDGGAVARVAALVARSLAPEHELGVCG